MDKSTNYAFEMFLFKRNRNFIREFSISASLNRLPSIVRNLLIERTGRNCIGSFIECVSNPDKVYALLVGSTGFQGGELMVVEPSGIVSGEIPTYITDGARVHMDKAFIRFLAMESFFRLYNEFPEYAKDISFRTDIGHPNYMLNKVDWLNIFSMIVDDNDQDAISFAREIWNVKKIPVVIGDFKGLISDSSLKNVWLKIVSLRFAREIDLRNATVENVVRILGTGSKSTDDLEEYIRNLKDIKETYFGHKKSQILDV